MISAHMALLYRVYVVCLHNVSHGEIVLWTGVALMAVPVLVGWQYATLISPIFVSFLLMKMSGVPLLERKADERWGGQEDYEAYKAATPVLIPRPPRTGN